MCEERYVSNGCSSGPAGRVGRLGDWLAGWLTAGRLSPVWKVVVVVVVGDGSRTSCKKQP